MKDYKLTPRQRNWARRDTTSVDAAVIEWCWRCGSQEGVVMASTEHRAKRLVKEMLSGRLGGISGRLPKCITVERNHDLPSDTR